MGGYVRCIPAKPYIYFVKQTIAHAKSREYNADIKGEKVCKKLLLQSLR
jgi:hypothetical protein